MAFPVPDEGVIDFVSSPRPGRVPRSAYLSPGISVSFEGGLEIMMGTIMRGGWDAES